MRKLFTLFAAAVLSVAAVPAMASHYMGGQITLQQDTSTPGAYIINLDLYRDMSGVGMGITETVRIVDLATGSSTAVTTTQISYSVFGGITAAYGVEEYKYSATTTLAPGHYKVYWNSCCRNAAIINVSAPSGHGIYFETELFVPAAGISNSTPVFLNAPTAFVSLHQPWSYNPLPYDADGDSLVWYVDTVQDAGASSGIPVNVIGWYLPSSDSAGDFTVDSLNGEITWTPSLIGNWVAGIVVEEYRNGVKIGHVRRDMQYIVVPDTATAGALTGIAALPMNAAGNIAVELEDSTSLNVMLSSTDPGTNSIKITAAGEPLVLPVSPAVFTGGALTTGTCSATFDWQPDASHARSNPYLTVFRVYSATPLYVLAKDYSVSITVVPKVADTTNTDTTNTDTVEATFAPLAISHLAMYPNPTSGEVVMTVRTLDAGKLEVNLFDLTGRKVQGLHSAMHPAGTQLLNFHANVPAGLYMVRVQSNGSFVTKRLVIN